MSNSPPSDRTHSPASVLDPLEYAVPKREQHRRDAVAPPISWYEREFSLKHEFHYADFGDARLTARLQRIGQTVGRAPGESIPSACADWASTKATYRFCDNDAVDPTEILASHAQAQTARLRDVDDLLVVGDTTILTFPSHPAKEGLGDIGNSETDLEGVKVHSSVGVRPDTTRMTGLLDQQVLIEDQQTDEKYDTNGRADPVHLESEQAKWLRGDSHARDALPDSVRPIFVHDRGADAFSFYRALTTDLADGGFVVRANQNRCVRTPAGEEELLFDWSSELDELGQMTIQIQQGGDRDQREADLAIAAGTCQILPPKNATDRGDPIEVNVVRVDESGRDEEPIQWVLLTSESVADVTDATTVIDYYQARWVIEEWHQVVKSGCKIEERQLETWERMEVLLSVYSVVAWKVLGLRALARGDDQTAPDEFLTETEQTILEQQYPEISGQEGKAYAVAVAKIGGYLDRGADPPPGWETMWKGMQQVRTWAEGYKLGSA